jgi:hypothetical protein
MKTIIKYDIFKIKFRNQKETKLIFKKAFFARFRNSGKALTNK